MKFSTCIKLPQLSLSRWIGTAAFLFGAVCLHTHVHAQDGRPVDLADPDSVQCTFSASESVSILFENNGTSGINFSSNALALEIGVSGTVDTLFRDTIQSGTLGGGNSRVFTLSGAQLDMRQPGAYQFEIIARLNTDTDRSNDTLRQSIYYNGISLQRPFRFGFEQTPATPFDSVDLDHYIDTENANNDGTIWQLLLGGQRTGLTSYGYNFANTNSSDDWVFLRCLPLDSGSSYELTFYHSLTFGSGSQTLQAWIGTAQSSTGMTDSLTSVTRNPSAAVSYQQASVTYTCDSTGLYYLGFYIDNPSAYTGTTNQYWLLDDVELRRLANQDVGVSAVPDPVEGLCVGGAETLRSRLRNFGQQPIDFGQDSVVVEARVFRNDTLLPQSYQTSIKQGQLAGGSAIDTALTRSLDMSIPGVYALELNTVFGSDQVAANDTLRVLRYKNGALPYQPYRMGFESDDPRDAYERNNAIVTEDRNQDNIAWGFFSANTGRTGTYPASIELSNNGDDWLFLGCFDRLGRQTYDLSYWAETTASSGANLEIYLSPDNNAASALSSSGRRIDSVGLSGTGYQNYRVRFQSNTGGVQYLAFRILSSTSSGDVYLDDLLFELVPSLNAQVLGFSQPGPKACRTGLQDIVVDVRNIGLDTIKQLRLEVEVNDTLTSSSGVFRNLMVPPGDTVRLNGGQINFQGGGNFDLEARVADPNGGADGDTTDNRFELPGLQPDTQRVRLPYTQNFNSAGLGTTAFGDVFNDNDAGQLDWEALNRGTATAQTGPSQDASGNGSFIYMESSSSQAGDSAVLVSNCMRLNRFSYPQLRFKYHMAGSAIGYLQVNALLSNGSVVPLLTLRGPQQGQSTDPWIDTTLILDDLRGQFIRLQWIGRVSPTAQFVRRSDIALDDIRISDGCASVSGSGPNRGFIRSDTVFVNSPTVFANQYRNTPLALFQWIAGDSLVSRERDPRLRFPNTGPDSLILISETCYGIDTTKDTFRVFNPTQPPEANFFTSRTEIPQGEQIRVFDLSLHGASRYRYRVQPATGVQFVNTGGDTAAAPIIRFDSSGIYTMQLIASNAQGRDTVIKNDLIEVLEIYQFCPNQVGKTARGLIYDDGGRFGNYANNRFGNAACELQLDPCARRIVLYIDSFEMLNGDFLEIYDGPDANGTALFSTANYPNGFTGSANAPNFPDSVVASSGQAFLRLSTNGSGTAPGFIIRYESDSAQLDTAVAQIALPDTICLNRSFGAQATGSGERLQYRWYVGHQRNNPLNLPLSAFQVSADSMPSLRVGPGDVSPAPTPQSPSLVDIKLEVFNCLSSDVSTKDVVVNAPTVPGPNVMDIEANKRFVSLREVVRLSPADEGCVGSYSWSFSPGTVRLENNTNINSRFPEVAFLDTGWYDITLEVRSGSNSRRVTRTRLIRALDYCSPSVGSRIRDIAITRVRLGNIDKRSGASPRDYTDFADSIRTDLEILRPYRLEIGRNSNLNAVSYAVWADLNRDGDFTDSLELLADTAQFNGRNWVDTIQLPAQVGQGYTRLRIGAALGNQPNTSCGPNTVGEYEDYGIVIVGDQSPPIITLTGGDTIQTEQGFPFSDPGYRAIDFVDGNLTSQVQVTGSVDTTQVGSYILRYQVRDSSGNLARVNRVVEVTPDATPPRLSLRGPNPLDLLVFDAYNEPGFTALDRVDGDLSNAVQVSGQVQTDQLGTYNLIYRVGDQRNNDTNAVRQVRVVDTLPPQLVLLGDNPLIIGRGGNFQDPGYTLQDNYYDSTEITVRIDGSVDTDAPGVYTLLYNAEDPSGNERIAQRQVRVDTATGMREFLALQLQLHPNPASDYICIEGAPAVDQLQSWFIVDASGRTVYQPKSSMRKSEPMRISVSEWPVGVYFFHGISWSKKVIRLPFTIHR